MMSREEFERRLNAVMTRQPLRPFTVVLTSGARCEIDDPQYIARNHNGLAGFITAAGEPFTFNYTNLAEIIPAAVEAQA
jgi:hypothetical protein